MELAEVSQVLNQHGWTAKLINKGYGISVGSFWQGYDLNLKKNYANNKLMINATPTWLNWLLMLSLGIVIFQQIQKDQPTVVFGLVLMAMNVYQFVQDRKQTKRLRAFLEAQGLSVEL